MEEPPYKILLEDEPVLLPARLLKYFETWHQMQQDWGDNDRQLTLGPASVVCADRAVVVWLVEFYQEYDEKRQVPSVDERPLAQLLCALKLCDYLRAELMFSVVSDAIRRRLLEGSECLLRASETRLTLPQTPQECQLLQEQLHPLNWCRKDILSKLGHHTATLLRGRLPPLGSALCCLQNDTFWQDWQGMWHVKPNQGGKFVRSDQVFVGLQASCHNHVIYMDRQQTLWGYGNNVSGQLGLPGDTVTHVVPVPLSFQPASRVMQIVCGGKFSVIRTADNTLWMTGVLGTHTNRSFTPLPRIEEPVLEMAAGYQHLVVRTATGLWGLGNYTRGQMALSLEEAEEKAVMKQFAQLPLQTPVGVVVCGDDVTLVLGIDNRLYVSGNWMAYGMPDDHWTFTPLKLPTEARVLTVACGASHLMVLCTDGLYAMGHNYSGQLGIPKPRLQIVKTFLRVPLSEPVLALACSYNKSVVLTPRGLMVCGDNLRDKLGLGLNKGWQIDSFTLVRHPRLQYEIVARKEKRRDEEEEPNKRQRLDVPRCAHCDKPCVLIQREQHEAFCDDLCYKAHYDFSVTR
jgi:alpha-tubulin suppressor-like RCC1 family protein